MYCKHCGNEMDPGAAVCVKCGYQKGAGEQYCQNCGSEITPGAAFCMHCGYATNSQETPAPSTQNEPKSRLLAGIFGIVLGTFGVHNFYLGYTRRAVTQLILGVLGCTSIISFIWGLVEGVQILSGSVKCDAEGKPLKNDM